MSTQLIRSFANGSVWMIEKDAAQAYLPLLANIISGKAIAPVKEKVIEPFLVNRHGAFVTGKSSEEGKSIAVVRVRGALTKENQECGPVGMVTIDNWINNALRDSSVGGILLDMDTPGGEAAYLPVLQQTIANANKPIVTWFNGMIASAGYGMASQSDEIYASHANDRVGSIGTMITLADYSAYFEKEGVKLKSIYATKSTDKNQEYKKALESEEGEKAVRENNLDPFNEAFLASVTSQREVDKSTLTGKMFNANSAIELGLIDGIKTRNEAIERVYELMEKEQNSGGVNQTANKQSINMKKNIQTVAALLGYESLEQSTKDGMISFSEEDVAKIGAALAAKGEAATQEEEEEVPNALMQMMEKINTNVSSLSRKQDALAGRMEVLENGPGAGKASTTPKADADAEDEDKVVNSWEDPNDPLNQQIARDLAE